MNKTPAIPTSLNIVALLFLFAGLHSIGEWTAMFRGEPGAVTLDILGIAVFFGLRRFSLTWRILALVRVWFFIAARVYFIAHSLSNGQWLEQIVPLCVALWVLSVLLRDDVRVLFVRPVPATA